MLCNNIDEDEDIRDLKAKYFTSAELGYEKIEVDGRNLIYTYFEDSEGKCEGWLASLPCWEESDLITIEKQISDQQLRNFIETVEGTSFLELEDEYEKTQGRSYPYTIEITLDSITKKVIYYSHLSANPWPEAFEEVKDALYDLIGKKSSQEN